MVHLVEFRAVFSAVYCRAYSALRHAAFAQVLLTPVVEASLQAILQLARWLFATWTDLAAAINTECRAVVWLLAVPQLACLAEYNADGTTCLRANCTSSSAVPTRPVLLHQVRSGAERKAADT